MIHSQFVSKQIVDWASVRVNSSGEEYGFQLW